MSVSATCMWTEQRAQATASSPSARRPDSPEVRLWNSSLAPVTTPSSLLTNVTSHGVHSKGQGPTAVFEPSGAPGIGQEVVPALKRRSLFLHPGAGNRYNLRREANRTTSDQKSDTDMKLLHERRDSRKSHASVYPRRDGLSIRSTRCRCCYQRPCCWRSMRSGWSLPSSGYPEAQSGSRRRSRRYRVR